MKLPLRVVPFERELEVNRKAAWLQDAEGKCIGIVFEKEDGEELLEQLSLHEFKGPSGESLVFMPGTLKFLKQPLPLLNEEPPF